MSAIKNTFSFLLLSFIFFSTLSAQQTEEEIKELIMEARKTMKPVESKLKEEGTDAKAVQLMATAKAISDSAYSYMFSLPGYNEAVLSQTLKEWKAKVKAEDETYIAMRKDAHATQRLKQDYFSSISEDYKNALAAYYELKY